MKLERRPQILRKLNFRELYDPKLSGLHAFDNITNSLTLTGKSSVIQMTPIDLGNILT